MIRDDLTWETNATLTYPSGNEGRSLRYREEWHTVQFELTNYTATSTMAALHKEITFDELKGDDWKPLTQEGRKRYLELRVNELKAPAAPFMFRVAGTASIRRNDTLNVVHVRNVPFARASKQSEAGFKARFEKVELSLVGADADQRGMLRFDREDDFGPDRLSLEFVVHRDKMRQLLADIRTRGEPPRLEVTATILLFVDEVHSGLKDYWMPDSFVMPADPGTAAAALSFVSVEWGRPPVETEADESSEDIVAETPKLDPQVETNKLLKNIQTAIWALFGVVAATAIFSLR